MKRAGHSTIYSSIMLLLIVLLFSCSDSESRLSPFGKNTAKVVITVGLQNDQASAYRSILDRIFHFFVKDAVAQTAPAQFSSYTVNVTAEGMTAIEQTFTTDTMTLTVPAGAARRFEVTAHVDPNSPSAALSFRGITTIDLAAGETVEVPVIMALNETKIVVPDWNNQRLIIIDNFTTPNWETRTAIMWTELTTTLRPHDVDFDSRGRIYIANYYSLGSVPGIIRVDDIDANNLLQASSSYFGNVTNVVTLAVDRTNNYLYFATTTALYRSTLDGITTFSRSLSSTPITPADYNIRGIDVDSQGMLYIVAEPISASPSLIIKYDPNNQSQIGSSYSTNLLNPWDVLVRGSNIYVANYGQSVAGYQILQLAFSDNMFTLVAHNGTYSTTTATGNFYGATRFLAIRNDGFFVADCTRFSPRAQMITFSDMNFSNWTPYGSFGTTVGYFKLYSTC